MLHFYKLSAQQPRKTHANRQTQNTLTKQLTNLTTQEQHLETTLQKEKTQPKTDTHCTKRKQQQECFRGPTKYTFILLNVGHFLVSSGNTADNCCVCRLLRFPGGTKN